jgi:drug/metabolite transporter (DMT)-like permease
VLWGSSFVFIKLAGHDLTPLQVAFGRVFLGAVVLLAVLAARRERLPRARRTWLHLSVLAVVLNVLPFTLFAFGEQHTSSVLAGIWNATTPLWVTVIGLMMLAAHQRPGRAGVAGLLVGFAGVLLVLAPWRHMGAGELVGNAACMLAAACYGTGIPYSRRHIADLAESGLALATAQLLVSSTVLGVAMMASGDGIPTHVGWTAFISVAELGVLGTGLAFELNMRVLRAAGAARSSTVTYVMPLVSTGLGVAVLGEPLHWNEPVGAAVILAGVVSVHVLGARRGDPGRPHVSRAAECEA